MILADIQWRDDTMTRGWKDIIIFQLFDHFFLRSFDSTSFSHHFALPLLLLLHHIKILLVMHATTRTSKLKNIYLGSVLDNVCMHERQFLRQSAIWCCYSACSYQWQWHELNSIECAYKGETSTVAAYDTSNRVILYITGLHVLTAIKRVRYRRSVATTQEYNIKQVNETISTICAYIKI